MQFFNNYPRINLRYELFENRLSKKICTFVHCRRLLVCGEYEAATISTTGKLKLVRVLLIKSFYWTTVIMKTNIKRIVWFSVIMVLAVLLYKPISYYVQTIKIYYKFQSSIQRTKDPIFLSDTKLQTYTPSEFDENGRLFYVCKVWGFLKYYLEFQTPRTQYIDSLLIRSIPQAIQAQETETFHAVIDNIIDSMRKYSSEGRTNPYPDVKDYILLDNKWMHDTIFLNRDIQQKLDDIFHSHSGMKNLFVDSKTSGTIQLTNKLTYPVFSDENLRLLGLFRYWNMINYFYVYKNYMDKSWDEVLYHAIPRFRIADTDITYRQSVYRLTNELRDAHTSVPPTIDNHVFGTYRPNFRMTCINDTFIISKIRVPQLEKQDFQVGDIVLQVDHNDVRDLYDSSLLYVCGGNKWSNQKFGCNGVLSRRDSTTLFTLLRNNDTIDIRSKNYTAYDLFQHENDNLKQNAKNKLYEWVNDSVAYLNLAFATSKNFNRNYKAIRSAAVIILDLRGGLHTHLISKVTDTFVPPYTYFAQSTYPDTRFPGMLRYCSSSQKIGAKNYFKGRIIVLVDEFTMSFGEYAAMAFQANPKTIIIGNATAGADGNTVLYKFPGGVTTAFSALGIYYPDLSPTQRVGVRIDHVTEPTIEDIKNNIDIAYEKARYIAEKGAH